MSPCREDKRLKPTATDRGADCISGLPLGLLHHVLYFLPPHEAVRTCVLSRGWRKVWKSMTTLRITDDGRWPRAADFNNFVNHLLLFRDRARLVEFEFCTYYHPEMRYHEFEDTEEVVRYIDMWIRHAFMCDVQVLRVIGMSLPKPMVLVNVPLIAKHLTTLELWSLLLDGCSMDFSRCEELEYLMMDDCRISAHKMFSKSLRCLCVCYCEFSDDIHTQICAPSLVSLHLDGNRGRTPFLESMPLLVTAFVRLGLTFKDLESSEKCVLLEALSNATDMELVAKPGLTIFKRGFNWCPAFNKLKTLVLNAWVVDRDAHALISVLHHAPILEKLTLELYDEHKYDIEMEESCSLVQQFLPSKHLKIVKVRCRNYDEMVRQFVKTLKTYGLTSITISFQEPDH